MCKFGKTAEEEENGKHFVPHLESNKQHGPKGIICCVTWAVNRHNKVK